MKKKVIIGMASFILIIALGMFVYGNKEDKNKQEVEEKNSLSSIEDKETIDKIDTVEKEDVGQEEVIENGEVDIMADVTFWVRDKVNLRSGDSVDSKLIKTLSIGDAVKFAGESDNLEWIQVDHRGDVGYVIMESLSVDKVMPVKDDGASKPSPSKPSPSKPSPSKPDKNTSGGNYHIPGGAGAIKNDGKMEDQTNGTSVGDDYEPEFNLGN